MILNEKTGLYDNYGLWHVPFWKSSSFLLWLKIGLAAIVGLIVLFVAYQLYIWHCNKQIPAWDKAFMRLKKLKNEKKVSTVYGKEMYGAFSHILKEYFALRFSFDLQGKTDSEFVDYIEHNHRDQSIVTDVKAVLSGAQAIKFANVDAVQAQIEQDYNRVIEIIQKTIPADKIT